MNRLRGTEMFLKKNKSQRKEKLDHIIEMMEPPKVVEAVVERDPDVRYSLKADFILPVITDWDLAEVGHSFADTLNLCLSRKKMSSVVFYKKAHIDRKLFSSMFSKKDYCPKKETAVACCLALELSIDETQRVLETAGYVLSDSKRWDMIIKNCINSKYFDIDDVNYILDYFGEKIL